MAQNFEVNTFNNLSKSSAMRRRHEFLSKRTREMTWSLDSISAEMSTELRSKLRQDLAGLTSFDDLKVTSAEQLEEWAKTNKAEPYLGSAVMVQVPVLCLGSSVTDRNRSILLERGLPEDYAKHTRFMAQGLTWGTVYLKLRKGTQNDGKRFVESYSLFVVSNSLLDLFVGPLVDGKRTFTAWPSSWIRTNKKKQAPKGKRQNRNKTKATGMSAFKLLLSKVKPKSKDVYRLVTLTMLTAVAKEFGTTFSGRKSQQLKDMESWITQTGDSDLQQLWDDAHKEK